MLRKKIRIKIDVLQHKDIVPVYARRRLIHPIRHDREINRARDVAEFKGNIGTMANKPDVIIREVAEIGFSPYAIFRDIIKDEYNHVRALYYNDITLEKVISIFEQHFNLKEFQYKTYLSYNRRDEESSEMYYFSEQEKIFISLNVTKEDLNIIILATNETDKLKQLVKDMEALRAKKTSSMLNIICYNGRGFYTEAFEIKIPENQKFSFFDCYNENFENVYNEIFKKLSVENGKGIVLFHGAVGSGKTSSLRKFITSLEKRIIYMPPDLADRISSPEFVTFLMENPNSILIIEDAENVLRAREAGGSQAVSNLLNVSDGILGDALHLQIVCTFNCGVDGIDQALMRPGRLIAEYKFDNLNPERANKLIDKVYEGEGVLHVNLPISLAEIFNIKEELIKTKENKAKFGFIKD